MAARVRTQFVNRDIVGFVKAGLAPEVAAKMRAEIARQALAEAQSQNQSVLGRVPSHETFVDGRKSTALESVKPTGSIIFEFDLLQGLFAWIGEQLVLHSPVLTGRYRQSHIFYADGTEVEPGAALPEAGEYAFVNDLPYSRKIERGLSDQAPDGVYEAVAALATRRFGNVARIRFTFRTVVGSTKDANTRQPAIVITLK